MHFIMSKYLVMNQKVKFPILVIVAVVELCLISVILFKHDFHPNGNGLFWWQLVSNVIIFIALMVQIYRAYRGMLNN